MRSNRYIILDGRTGVVAADLEASSVREALRTLAVSEGREPGFYWKAKASDPWPDLRVYRVGDDVPSPGGSPYPEAAVRAAIADGRARHIASAYAEAVVVRSKGLA